MEKEFATLPNPVQRQLLLADASQDPEVPQLGTGPTHHGVLFFQHPHPPIVFVFSYCSGFSLYAPMIFMV